jgi:hypothetical protein
MQPIAAVRILPALRDWKRAEIDLTLIKEIKLKSSTCCQLRNRLSSAMNSYGVRLRVVEVERVVEANLTSPERRSWLLRLLFGDLCIGLSNLLQRRLSSRPRSVYSE